MRGPILLCALAAQAAGCAARCGAPVASDDPSPHDSAATDSIPAGSDTSRDPTTDTPEFPDLALLHPVPQIVTADGYTCWLGLDRKLSCWGEESGVLHDTDSYSNTEVLYDTPTDTEFAKVDTGISGFMCGLLLDGSINCWGYGSFPLPDGIVQGRWIDIEVGARHVCVQAPDRTLSCWRMGSVPLGGVLVAETPTWPVKDFCVGVTDEGACAIDDERELHCWGDLAPYQYAIGYLPTQKLDKISCGSELICGLDADGTLHCSADAYYEEGVHPVPGSFVDLAVGVEGLTQLEGSLLLDADGGLWTWSQHGWSGNPHGAYLTPTGDYVEVPQGFGYPQSAYFPHTPPQGTGYRLGDGAWYHDCVISPSLQPLCWGKNLWGQVTPTSP